MIAKYKLNYKVIVLAIAVGLFGMLVSGAAGAEQENVSIDVSDKTGRLIPFASIIDQSGEVLGLTGKAGQAAKFNLEPGKHKLTIVHPLVEKKNGQPATGKVVIKLDHKKISAVSSIRMKGNLQTDATAPIVTPVAPRNVGGQDGTIYNNQPVSIVTTAVDPESNVALVEATLDGQDLGQVQSKEGNQYRWTVPALTVGSHRLSFSGWSYTGSFTTGTLDFNVVPVAEPTGTLEGLVSFNSAPLASALVALSNGVNVQTGQDGRFRVTSLVVGDYSLTVSADGLSTANKTFRIERDLTTNAEITLIDGVAPAVPANLAVVNINPSSNNQTANWSAVTDRSGVSYEIERYLGNTLAETKSPSDTTASFSGLNEQTEYGYKVRAKDGANNFSAWSDRVNYKTKQAPTATWVSPTAGQTVSGTFALKVDYAAFDGNKVERVNFVIGDTSYGQLTPNQTNGRATLDWDSKRLSNGNYTLNAIVTDNEGNTKTRSVNFKIDNPPDPTSGSVSGMVSYASRSVVGATVKTDDGKTGTTDSMGRYSITGVGAGSRTITVTATDLDTAVKTGTVETNRNTVVDFILTDSIGPSTPTISAVVNVKPTASTQEVTWSASTDASGVMEYEVERLANGVVAETKKTAGTIAVFSSLAGGTEYGYRVRAKDKAATPNYSAYSSEVKKKTEVSPTTAWVEPTNNATVSGSVTLKVNYTVTAAGDATVKLINVTDSNSVLHTATVSAASGQVTFTWLTAALSGAKTLRAQITDSQDNVATSDISVTISSSPGAIAGAVTEEGGTTVVADLPVVLKRGGADVASVKTDANGRYKFENLAVANNYALYLADEGYVDKTVDPVSVTAGATTGADVQIKSLPRVTVDINSLRELAGPGRAFETPAGMSIKTTNDELIIVDYTARDNAYFYNAKTGEYRRSAPINIIYASGAFVAHNLNEILFARYGDDLWTNALGENGQVGEKLGYQDLISSPDYRYIYARTPDALYRFDGRRITPAAGYDLEPVIGTKFFNLAINDRFLFANGNGKLNRLPINDLTNINKKFSKTMGFTVRKINHLPGTRTLLAQNASTGELRLLDSRTFTEYQTINLPTNNFVLGAHDIKSINDNGKIIIYVSVPDISKVYSFDAR